MSNKPKKQLSEKQKKVLEENNFKNKPRSERCEIAANGAKKTNQIKKAKIARENSKDWAWNKYGIELVEDIVKNGSTKDKVELVKTLFPNDKQINENINREFKLVVANQEDKELVKDI